MARRTAAAALLLALAAGASAAVPRRALLANCAAEVYPGGYKVVDPSLACDGAHNYECDACSLYETIYGCSKDPSKCDGWHGSYYYSSPHTACPTCHPTWLIEPTAPLRGAEDIAAGGAAALAATNPLWGTGIADAVNGAAGRPAIPANKVAAVMNSVSYRSKHQAHIHVSWASKSLKDCASKAPSAYYSWATTSCPITYVHQGCASSEVVTASVMIMRAHGAGSVSSHAASGIAAAQWADAARTTAIAALPDGADTLVLLLSGRAVGDHDLLAYDCAPSLLSNGLGDDSDGAVADGAADGADAAPPADASQEGGAAQPDAGAAQPAADAADAADASAAQPVPAADPAPASDGGTDAAQPSDAADAGAEQAPTDA